MLRLVALAALLLVPVGSAAADDPKEPPFWPTKVGSRWEYDNGTGESTSRREIRAEAAEAARCSRRRRSSNDRCASLSLASRAWTSCWVRDELTDASFLPLHPPGATG